MKDLLFGLFWLAVFLGVLFVILPWVVIPLYGFLDENYAGYVRWVREVLR